MSNNAVTCTILKKYEYKSHYYDCRFSLFCKKHDSFTVFLLNATIYILI